MCRLCDVFIFYFLIGGKLLYNVLLVSGIWQCESVTIIYVSPSSEPLFPPHIPALKFIKEHQAGSLDYTATFHCFTHDGVYMSMLLARFSSPSPSPAVSTHLFFTRFISIICQGPYICVNIQYLFYSVWLTWFCIGGFRFIPLTTTNSQFVLFHGWVIFHCI